MRVQIPSFQFDDIMLETFRRGQAVEVFFKNFSGRYQQHEYQLNKDEFMQAIASLGIKWATDTLKLSEMFDAIDLAAHSSLAKYVSTMDMGEAVL